MTPSLYIALLGSDVERLQTTDLARLSPLLQGELSRLVPSDVPELTELRFQLAKLLRAQLTPEWIKTADLATVFAVLDGLHCYDASMITGTDIGHVAERLVASEMQIGGPYADSSTPDPVANAYILNCLEWMAAPLPKVVAFVEASFGPYKNEAVRSDYGLYLLCSEGVRSSLSHVSATSGLGKTGANRQYATDILCAALCAAINASAVRHVKCAPSLEPGCADAVLERCRHELRALPRLLQAELDPMLSQITRADPHKEISQLPEYFARLQKPGAVRRETLVTLGAANVYAWIAYTVYDDFLDNEGAPHLLGAANYAFRAMISKYREAVPNCPEYQAFVDHTLTAVEASNIQEAQNFRFEVSGGLLRIHTLPDFGQCELLADRATFHVMGPMAILALQGTLPGTDVWDNTLTAFKHYLIARQLNDDIHDWLDDLHAGNATFVVVKILQSLQLGPGLYRLSELVPLARQRFWRQVLPEVCDTAIVHAAAARKLFQQTSSSFPEQSNGLAHLLNYVEESLHRAMQKKDQSEALLNVFQNSR